MVEVKDHDLKKKMFDVFQSIFASQDPYGEPFQLSIEKRLLLYPFRYGLHESQPWLALVMSAIKSLGEDGFYVSVLNTFSDLPEEETTHWYVPLSEAHLYIDLVFPVQNAIYSVNGTWGIICSDEDHAILGGPNAVVASVQRSIPDLEFRVISFLQMWKGYYEQNTNVNINWIPKLFSHIYKGEIPDYILNDSELRALVL